MAIKFAPPWLRSLGSVSSPLVDDASVQDEIIQLKLQMEREDRQRKNELFVGPMAQPTPSAPEPLPFEEQFGSDEPTRGRGVLAPPDQDLPPGPRPAPIPKAGSDLPGRAPEQPAPVVPEVGGSAPTEPPVIPSFLAPPSAPPPPPPADRPPGTFHLEPDDTKRKRQHESQ